MTPYEPEDQFLIACLRSHFQSHVNPRIDPNYNWDCLMDSARRNRVVPLLYLALKSSKVPQALKEDFDDNVIHSLNLAAELRNILGFLDAASIPFKGPILAAEAYGNVSYRQFDDLDLLIHERDFPRVKSNLLENGYIMVDKLSRDQEAAFLKSHHHCQFFKPISGIFLEVHWQISRKIYSFRLDVPSLFQRANHVKLFGQKMLSLSREDAMLVLSEHGTRHYWSRLAWICDIAKLSQSELDWDQTMKIATSIGSRRSVLLAVSLAKDVLDLKTPDLDSYGIDKEIPLLSREVQERLFTSYSQTDPNIERFYIRSRERRMDRLRYYAYRATIPTKEDWDWINIPSCMFPFYNLVRPIRLISKYGSKVAKWLR